MKSDKIPLYVVKFFGFFLFAFGILNFAILVYGGALSEIPIMIVVLFMTAWHLIMGIGLMKREKLGLILLKWYLGLMSLGYPIGTMISRKSLAYLREHEIDKYFDSKNY